MQINISYYYIYNSYFMYFNIVHGKKMSGSNSARLNQRQRPRIEPGPAAWESDTLARSHTTSYLIRLYFKLI